MCMHWQAGKLAYRYRDNQSTWMDGRQVDRQTDRQAGRQTHRQADTLVM
jgi:hypothetical protein